MGAVIGTVLGCALAALGFAAMRDPMRWSLLGLSSPRAIGYYQRMVLETSSRLQLRVLGAFMSLFGSVIFTGALGGLLNVQVLHSVSTALLVLMSLVFCGAWVFGLTIGIIRVFRGQWRNWFQVWRTSMQLGPVNVDPAITPAMEREARAFTAAFLFLVAVAVIAALFRAQFEGRLP